MNLNSKFGQESGRRGVKRYARAMGGFNMIELVVVLAVMGVLLAVGMPSLRSLIVTQRVKNASFDVYSSIQAARGEAVTRNTTVTITPNAGTNWANGWVVSASGGAVTLKTQDAFQGITITGPATLSYNGAGRLAAAATPISLTAPDGIAEHGRCITIDLSGKPATAKGVC